MADQSICFAHGGGHCARSLNQHLKELQGPAGMRTQFRQVPAQALEEIMAREMRRVVKEGPREHREQIQQSLVEEVDQDNTTAVHHNEQVRIVLACQTADLVADLRCYEEESHLDHNRQQMHVRERQLVRNHLLQFGVCSRNGEYFI